MHVPLFRRPATLMCHRQSTDEPSVSQESQGIFLRRPFAAMVLQLQTMIDLSNFL